MLIDNANDVAPQWCRLIGEFLSPRLGGSALAWGQANVPAFERQTVRWQAEMGRRGPADIRGIFAKDARLWFVDICDAAGVARPAAEEADRIAADTVSYVKAHLVIRPPRKGLWALRALRRRGVAPHITSNDARADLVEFLQRIGVRHLFDRIYGTDVVNTWKFGPGTTARS